MDSSSAVLKDRPGLIEDPSDQADETTAGAGQSDAKMSTHGMNSFRQGLSVVVPGHGSTQTIDPKAGSSPFLRNKNATVTEL